MVRPSVVNEVENAIAVIALDSFVLWTPKNDASLTPCLRRDGYWESWITSWFTRHVQEGDFVVDVGANVGYFTMLFERLTGEDGRVVAYECNPELVGLLNMTKVSNDANFVVEPVALSDRRGVVDLTFPGEYTGSASIVASFDPKWGETRSIKVATYTLDEEFDGMDTPQCIKIDAEGAEEMILRGGKELLARHDAPVLVLEYTPEAYSKNFNEWLFEYGEVTRINTSGWEEYISRDALDTLTDWEMLVVRKR